MIAQRKMVDVTEPRIVLDLGEEFSLFKDHRVEIIIIAEAEATQPKSASISMKTAFNRLSGAMRDTVKYMANDFDECNNVQDWEALK
jgi:hypothetical protein